MDPIKKYVKPKEFGDLFNYENWEELLEEYNKEELIYGVHQLKRQMDILVQQKEEWLVERDKQKLVIQKTLEDSNVWINKYLNENDELKNERKELKKQIEELKNKIQNPEIA